MHDTYSQYEQTHLVLKVGFCVNVYIKRFESIHTRSGIEVGRGECPHLYVFWYLQLRKGTITQMLPQN